MVERPRKRRLVVGSAVLAPGLTGLLTDVGEVTAATSFAIAVLISGLVLLVGLVTSTRVS